MGNHASFSSQAGGSGGSGGGGTGGSGSGGGGKCDGTHAEELHELIRRNDLGSMRGRIENNNWCVTSSNAAKFSLLHKASYDGRLDIVEYLVGKGADKEAKDQNNDTPLHVASLHGHLAVVRYLVEKGASKEIKNNNYKKPIDLANDRGKNDIVGFLGGGGALSGGGGTIELYQQCGGKGGSCSGANCVDAPWPDKSCKSGSSCKRANEWHHQCEP